MQRIFRTLGSALPLFLLSFSVVAEVHAQVEATVEATPAEKLPIAISARPFTLPMGVFELDMDAQGSVAGDLSSHARIGVGVTDDVQLDVFYGGVDWMNLNPAQSMALGLGVYTGANSVFANMVYFYAPLTFDQDNIATSVSFAAPTVFGLGAGFSIMALAGDNGFINLNFLPSSDADKIAAAEGVDPVWTGVNASFHLPIALNFQAGKHVYMSLGTELASWSTTGASTYIWEATPVDLKTTFSINNQVDIGLKVGFADVQRPGDTFGGMFSVTFRAGALDA